MAIWAVSLLSDELSPAVLTATVVSPGIRSLPRISIVADHYLNRALPPGGSM
jgi:hypothetical protein